MMNKDDLQQSIFGAPSMTFEVGAKLRNVMIRNPGQAGD
jgi:hypothetical protein